ncbi:MAG TPA: 3-isopropylmalate dehydratase small subunit [Blastocatellia bacterium]|nr:3-isopropylmalate dehydratase small subunit [Blastocatellia bacterium]
MKEFRSHSGLVVPFDRVNVDTDQIIPKQFLKRTERTGFGQFLFFDWRYNPDGNPNPAFELNQPQFEGATILLARDNFGCGSSREHAPWALDDYGFRSIIAPSFADIFYNNCFQNGLLPVRLGHHQIDQLFMRAKTVARYVVTVDLESQKVSDGLGLDLDFQIKPFEREKLLRGLDDVGYTLQFEKIISDYEARRHDGMRSR